MEASGCDVAERPDLAASRRMFADFARHTASGAPLYAELAAGIAADDELAGLLLHAPPVQRQPVLLFACVHSLVLRDPDCELAAFYPNLHPGARPSAPAVEVLRRFCAERAGELHELLATRRTQTNEIGRTALFQLAFGLLEREVGPLAHVDVGASAGLNLLGSHYDYRYDPGGEIATGSTVRLTCSTRGEPPVPASHPTVSAAIGLDANPVDVGDPEQAAWLEACVWPDQVERFERLAAAIDIANEVGIDVRRGDAVDDIALLVAEAAAAAHPVVTTSWVLNYVTPEQRRAFVATLDSCASSAELSWVYAENPVICAELPGAGARQQGGDEPTALVLVRWRDGERTTEHLADTHAHGRWLHWTGGCSGPQAAPLPGPQH